MQDEFIRNVPADMTVLEVDYYRATDDVVKQPDNEIDDLTLRAISKVMKISNPIASTVECISCTCPKRRITFFRWFRNMHTIICDITRRIICIVEYRKGSRYRPTRCRNDGVRF